MFYNNNQLLLEGDQIAPLCSDNKHLKTDTCDIHCQRCGKPVFQIGTPVEDIKMTSTAKTVVVPASAKLAVASSTTVKTNNNDINVKSNNGPKKEVGTIDFLDEEDEIAQPPTIKKIHLFSDKDAKELVKFLSQQHGIVHTKRSVLYIIGTVLDLLGPTIGVSKKDVRRDLKYLVSENTADNPPVVMNNRGNTSSAPKRVQSERSTPKTKKSIRDPGELLIQKKYGPNFKDDPAYRTEIRQFRKDLKTNKKKKKASA